jgi:hypothetical protein
MGEVVALRPPAGWPSLRSAMTISALCPTDLKLAADDCMQPSKVPIDFRRVVFDDNFSGNLSDRCEVEHARFPLQLKTVYHANFMLRNTGFDRG